MEKLKEFIDKITDFFGDTVWQDPVDAGPYHIFLLQGLRVCLLTIRGFKNQLIFLRASALVYTTMLAIVPLLALAFSVLKGFGFHGRIESMLINFLTAEQQEVSKRIVDYIANTNFKALGAFGLSLLIYTVVKMLNTVEMTFNSLWGITRARSVLRKISDYISVLVISPLLLVISLALIASLSSNTVVAKLNTNMFFEHFFVLFETVIPLVGIWIAFTAIYIFMPNTRVKFLPGLIAGVFSGTLWGIAFQAYTQLNIGVARYNTIYGTFAALPIFLIWLYISWLILLIGAQLSYAIQNVKSYQQEMSEYEFSNAQKEYMALNMMFQISKRFFQGQTPMTAEELSYAISSPKRVVRRIAEILGSHGLLKEILSEEIAFQPAKDLHLISVAEVYEAMRDEGQVDWRLPEEKKEPGLEALLEARKRTDQEQLGRITMLDLLQGEKKDC
ncbi:hypothetical protein DRO38_08195 [Candidatus Bathyarchaeota archaeon]|nr:MAG: hypothetical protein DRO38_08195 [Candidatus Bathyarchaeota archaeon]